MESEDSHTHWTWRVRSLIQIISLIAIVCRYTRAAECCSSPHWVASGLRQLSTVLAIRFPIDDNLQELQTITGDSRNVYALKDTMKVVKRIEDIRTAATCKRSISMCFFFCLFFSSDAADDMQCVDL